VVAAPAEAPACAPQAPSEHLNACVALGEKNAALHQQLGKLEEKVKVLQGAAPVAVPAAAPAPAAKEAPQAAPKGAPRIHRKPKKVEPPEAETPWLLIGGAIGAVLAIGALALVLLRRRKRSSFGKIPAAHKPAKIPKAGEGEPKPHFMAAVKARLMPGKVKEAAPAAEPVTEQAE
jgi:LPXTG-motif cell wall-anchored protein